MTKMIFINLPVIDLPRSIAFYQAIGARKEDRFSDETAACMVLSDSIHVMLLTHPKFAKYTPRPIADARSSTEVLIALSTDSRTAVDAMVEAAAGSGGTADPRPAEDLGFMFNRAFEDPDGHIWEIIWMDMAAAEGAMAGAA